MDRRTFLRATVPAGSLALAGCTGGPDTPESDASPGGGPTVTATATGTPGSGGGVTGTATNEPTATATAGKTDTPSTDTPPTDDTPTDTSPTDDPSTATATATAEPTPTRTPTPEPTPTPTPDMNVTVAPGGSLRFDPTDFTIAVGDTVLWTWDGSGHNVKHGEGDVPADSDWTGTPGDSTYGSGYRYSYTFTVAGAYDYYCVPHRSVGMRGSFTVE